MDDSKLGESWVKTIALKQGVLLSLMCWSLSAANAQQSSPNQQSFDTEFERDFKCSQHFVGTVVNVKPMASLTSEQSVRFKVNHLEGAHFRSEIEISLKNPKLNTYNIEVGHAYKISLNSLDKLAGNQKICDVELIALR